MEQQQRSVVEAAKASTSSVVAELQSQLRASLHDNAALNQRLLSLQERLQRSSSACSAEAAVAVQATILDHLSALPGTDSVAAAMTSVTRHLLDSRQNSLGALHPASLDLMNCLGNCLQRQGRVAEAEPIYKQCLQLREQALGPEHASTLSSLNNYASICQRLQRVDDAERMHKKCLELRAKTLGR
jgi:tetratricopeptide (TPR) repeat protein